MLGRPAKIALGRIVDADIVYLNGKQIGQTTYQYPQRRYQLPAGALIAGKNILDRKKEIGERLALWAEKLKYGDSVIVASGPIYRSSTAEGNKIRVRFSSAGSGLVSRDGEVLSEFAIAGSDRKFVWAKAKIIGDDVIVWNDSVARPVYVRYAWADNPDIRTYIIRMGFPPRRSKVKSSNTGMRVNNTDFYR